MVIIGQLIAQGSTQNSTLNQANKFMEIHDYDHAAQYFEMVVKEDPANLDATRSLALCYKRSGQAIKALQTYAFLCIQERVDPETYFEYADALRMEGAFKEAKKYYLEYAQFNPVIGNYFAASCDYAYQQLSNPSNCKLKNLESNSEASDFAPVVVGEELLLASTMTTDIQAKSPEATNLVSLDLKNLKLENTQSNVLNGILQKEMEGLGNISFGINSREVAYSKSASADVKTVLNSSLNLAIYFADVDETGNWTNMREFEYNVPTHSTGFPNLNEKVMYFASNRPGGFGGYDLYASYRENGQWSSPVNLGAVINSPGNEISPFFKNNTLYFSSDWHQGFGSLDVFKIELAGETWSNLENMGTCVNSSMDEYYFVTDEKDNGFFTSNRFGGKGKADVYQSFKLNLAQHGAAKASLLTEIGDKGLNHPVQAPVATPAAAKDVQIFEDPSVLAKAEMQAVKMYFIQITSLVKYNEKMDSRFHKYSTYGDVYKFAIDETVKIRVGPIADINEAVAILNLIKKSGLKDAFIVSDVVDENRATLIAKSSSNVDKQKQTENPSEPEPPAVVPEEGKYKIRVSEYKAPDWFDITKINDLGTIEHWTKSGLTIIVLGSYRTEESAKDILGKLKARGFKEAYVVVEENGKLFRL